MHECVFEEFGFQSFFHAPSTDLCAYRFFNDADAGAQKRGCLVIDAGYSFTCVTMRKDMMAAAEGGLCRPLAMPTCP